MLLKLCVADRSKKHLVSVTSAADFQQKVRNLFSPATSFRYVLEEDGTIIDDENMKRIIEEKEDIGLVMILKDNEVWYPGHQPPISPTETLRSSHLAPTSPRHVAIDVENDVTVAARTEDGHRSTIRSETSMPSYRGVTLHSMPFRQAKSGEETLKCLLWNFDNNFPMTKLEELGGCLFRIAVMGSSFVAKTTLIKTMLNIDTLEELTIRGAPPEPRSHGSCNDIEMWYIPSFEDHVTHTNSDRKKGKQSFLKLIQLDRYDMCLLLTSSNFTEDDRLLVQEAAKKSKRVFYVRTNLGADLKQHSDEMTIVQRIRQDIMAECNRFKLGTRWHLPLVYRLPFTNKESDQIKSKLFMVECSERSHFDFPNLQVNIVEELLGGLIHAFKSKLFREFGRFANFLRHNKGQKVFRVAVAGNAGSGKSSFIKAIGSVSVDDDGRVVEGFSASNVNMEHPSLIWYDLPRLGKLQFSKVNNVQNIDLEQYDLVLLLFSDRFSENDERLTRQLTKHEKKYYLLRTKMSHEITKLTQDSRSQETEENVRRKIQREVSFLWNDSSFEIFLIDSNDTEKYDFEKLKKKLFEEFPRQWLRMHAERAVHYCGDIVKSKVQTLRSRIYQSSLISSVVAAVPLPGVSIAFDTGLVYRQLKTYFSEIGIDHETMKSLAGDLKLEFDCLSDIIGSYDFQTIRGIQSFLGRRHWKTLVGVASGHAVEELVKYIPAVGTVAASATSFTTTQLILYLSLTRIEEIALKVVRRVINHIFELPDEQQQQQHEEV